MFLPGRFGLLAHLTLFRPFLAPDDGTGAGDPPPGDTSPAAPSGADAAPAAKWYEAEGFPEAARTMLTAKGFAVDDPADAARRLTEAYANAEKRLGKPADQLLDRPAKDQPITDWMRANADLFGIPEAPEKYDIKPPKDWPKDAAWDAEGEAALRQAAHQLGMTNDQASTMAQLYATKVLALQQAAAADLSRANDEMLTELRSQWGDKAEDKMTRAAQAASVLAERAGVDAQAIEAMASALSPKIGDAGTIRLFAALSDMMGDDTVVTPGGGSSMGLSMGAAEAKAALAEFDKPGGDYAKAVAARDRPTLERLKPQREALIRAAAGS